MWIFQQLHYVITTSLLLWDSAVVNALLICFMLAPVVIRDLRDVYSLLVLRWLGFGTL